MSAPGSEDDQAEDTEASVDPEGDISTNLIGYQTGKLATALSGTLCRFCTLPYIVAQGHAMPQARCVVHMCLAAAMLLERLSASKGQVMAKLNSVWDKHVPNDQKAMLQKEGGDFSRWYS